METEIFGLCGTMLGMLELLADADDGSDPQRGAWIADAARCGADLRERIEAVVLLARHDLDDAIKTEAHSVRKLVTHAMHGARIHLGESDIEVQLPEGDAWGAQAVAIDLSRLDRMLSSMTEQLGAALGPTGRVEVSVEDVPSGVQLSLKGRVSTGPRSTQLSPLLQKAWQRLLSLHRGTLWVDPQASEIVLTLPLAGSTAADGGCA